MKKAIIAIVALYLVASCVFSIGHAISDDPWDFRQHRNGLLCMEIADDSLVIYSPFCNWADVFLLGICHDEDGWYTFSDGFHNFGEWKVE